MDTPTNDLYTKLKEDGRPIVLYGMGDGGDKIIRVLSGRGLEIADVFASDEFVRGQQFHGKTVLRYADILEKYGSRGFLLLVAFASTRPELICRIRALSEENDLFIPDVPVALGSTPLEEAGSVFDAHFYTRHKGDLAAAKALLEDELSRALFDGVVEGRLSGKPEYLFQNTSSVEDIYRDLHAETFSHCMDLGAYTGDTIRELLTYCPYLEKVYAMEPDKNSYKRLCRFLSQQGLEKRVEARQTAAWQEDTLLTFSAKGNRNSTLLHSGHGAKSVEVEGLSPDSFAQDRRIDYIKYDVEGAEAEALIGSRHLIEKQRPTLLVSLYHRPEDLFALPLLVHKLAPEGAYRYRLRRLPGFPAWDLNLLVLPKT